VYQNPVFSLITNQELGKIDWNSW